MSEAIQSLVRFLRRAISDLPISIGSNHLGVWFPLVPTALFIGYQCLQNGWRSVRHDLFIGTVITAISYGLLFLYCIIRNVYREHVTLAAKEKQTREELEEIRDRPAWSGYASEQVWRGAVDEQNRLVNLGHFVDGLFSPPQIEALTIAKRLGELLREVEPLKLISDDDYPDTCEDQTRKILDRLHSSEEYNSKFARVAARYIREFAPRVKETTLLFKEEGFNESELGRFFDGVTSQDDLMRIRARLICLAHRKNGVELSMRKPNEA